MQANAPTLDDAAVSALRDEAVETLPGAGDHALVLVCEHAGAAVPAPWKNLGLDPAFLATHFAFDLGAGDLTRAFCADLGAPGVLARYSRLFLDYNRYPHDWEQMRPDMGSIPVPGNRGLTEAARSLRRRIVADPLALAIDNAARDRRAMVGIHSFTPVMSGGTRALDIGVLGRRDCGFHAALSEALRRRAGLLRVVENEPYDWQEVDAFCLTHHAEARGLPCVALEFNSDTLGTPEGLAEIRALVGAALNDVLEAGTFSSCEVAGSGTRSGRLG